MFNRPPFSSLLHTPLLPNHLFYIPLLLFLLFPFLFLSPSFFFHTLFPPYAVLRIFLRYGRTINTTDVRAVLLGMDVPRCLAHAHIRIGFQCVSLELDRGSDSLFVFPTFILCWCHCMPTHSPDYHDTQ